MPPTPTPLPDELVLLMEVMGENDYTFVSRLVNAGSDEEATAKWRATREDLDEWKNKVRGKYAKLNGRVELDPSTRGGAVRARVRTRYGLTERVPSDVTGGLGGSCSVPVETW